MKKQVLLALSLSLCLLLAACGEAGNSSGSGSSADNGHSADGSSPSDSSFDPWDNMGGGGTAESVGASKVSVADYAPDSYIVVSDEQKAVGAENATAVDLSSLSDATAPAGTSFQKNKLTVSSAGVYVLTGKLNGCISVEGVDGTVRLILNGAEISTTAEQTSAAIVFKQTDSLRILTVAEGTTNTLSDSAGDTDADGDGAAVQAKKCSLTVNGGGRLLLKGVGESAAGLKVKKQLTILDTTLEIQAVKNGIKADKKILVFGADVTVSAGNDGVKTDMEASSAEEAAEYAADPEAGYIYVENSSFDITAGDDGFSANNGIYFANRDEDTVKIQSGGGAPSQVTESSSDNASGKGIKTDGITLVEGESETEISASYEENYSLVVTGGNFQLDCNDDALHSNGNLLIAGGVFAIATGDDGIHADYLTKITDGEIAIDQSYEGVEGAGAEIGGGKILIPAVDDGINAANADLKNYDFYLYIGGGNVFVDAEGDGIDSNGTVTIEGGKTVVYGPTGRDDGSLDSEKGVLVNGGELVAVGSVGMVENPASNSAQCYLSIHLSSAQAAGTQIAVYDADGNELLSLAPGKTYQSVIVSLSSFEKGKTYTVTIGETAYTATLNSVGTALGSNQHGGGNQGFNPDWGGGKSGR